MTIPFACVCRGGCDSEAKKGLTLLGKVLILQQKGLTLLGKVKILRGVFQRVRWTFQSSGGSQVAFP